MNNALVSKNPDLDRFFIGGRKKNGQIQWLWDGFSLPELFKTKEEITVLVDYSPVIEALHRLHQTSRNEVIFNEFRALYNYWQDSKSYTIESVKLDCNKELSKQANSLLPKLQTRLEARKSEFYSAYRKPGNEVHDVVRALKDDANTYIQTLMCFIHSKASLDIKSFRSDKILNDYGIFLQDLLFDLYRWIVRDNSRSYSDSILKYFAFEHSNEPGKLEQHLYLDGKGESASEFKLRVLNEAQTYGKYDQSGHYHKEVSIRYDSFGREILDMVEIFKDLIFKISMVNQLLTALREGTFQWDGSNSAVEELNEEILRLNPPKAIQGRYV